MNAIGGVVVPLTEPGAQPLARAPRPGERLLMFDVINAAGRIMIHTIWATEADWRYGRRRTDTETVVASASDPIAEAAAVFARLRDLVPLVVQDPLVALRAGEVTPLRKAAAAEMPVSAAAAMGT